MTWVCVSGVDVTPFPVTPQLNLFCQPPSLGLVSSLEVQADLHLILQTLLELVLCQRQPLLQDRHRLEEGKGGEREDDGGEDRDKRRGRKEMDERDGAC